MLLKLSIQRGYLRHIIQRKRKKKLKRCIWVQSQKPGKGIRKTDLLAGNILSLGIEGNSHSRKIDMIQDQDMIIGPVMINIDPQEGKRNQTVVIDCKVHKDHPILRDALDANVIVAQRMQRL